MNASDLRGDDSHQQSRNEGEAAAGNVAADGIDGPDELGDGYATLNFKRPGKRQLFFGDAADISFRMTKGGQKFGTHLFARGVNFVLRDPHAAAAEIHAVKFFGAGEESGVAAFANVGDDFCGDALGFAVALVASAEEIVFRRRA